jgi:hypothetical protein
MFRFFLLAAVGLVAALPFSSAQTPAPTGKPVSLHLKDAMVKDALAEIKKQTDIAVEDRLEKSDTRLTLDLPNTPFWPALDQIAEKIGAAVVIGPRKGYIALEPRASRERQPVAYSGPFRLAMKEVKSTREFDRGRRSCVSTIEVSWEPRLLPLFLESRPHDVVAIDDKGARHTMPGLGSSPSPVDGRIAEGVILPLPVVPRTVGSFQRVQGRLTAIAPTRMIEFRLPSLARLRDSDDDADRKRSENGASVTVTNVLLRPERWIVRVAVEMQPGGESFDSNQDWLVNNRMVLVNKGERWLPSAYDREGSDGRKGTVSYQFTDRRRLAGAKPEDWSVVYQSPEKCVVVPIPFVFENVELP